MNELTTKFKNGVKKHWKKGLVIVTAGGTLLYVGYKMGTKGKMDFPKGNFFMANWPAGEKVSISEFVQDFKLGEFSNIKDLDKPTTDLGEIMDLWTEVDKGEKTLNAIVHDVNINDLGWLAGDIADKTFDRYPELKGMTQIDAVFTYYKPAVEAAKEVANK